MANSTKRIAISTGGGDAPGLNAVIRAVAKAANRREWKAIGIIGGYEGLLAPQRTGPARVRIWAMRPSLPILRMSVSATNYESSTLGILTGTFSCRS
jgi:hypothetical protein